MRLHLTCQAAHLQLISRVFEQNQVVTVQAHGSVLFPLVEGILQHADDAHVPVMGANSEHVADLLVSGCISHQIIQHDKVRVPCVHVWYAYPFSESDIGDLLHHLHVQRLPFSVAPDDLSGCWIDQPTF